MPEATTAALQEAIRNLHGCKSVWVESVPLVETFRGETVWQGVVEVFDLIDHPTATRCYAWSHEIDDSDQRRFVAVLHRGRVDSPLAAVQAAIVQGHRENP